MAIVAQLVRAPACGAGGRRFESGLSPHFFRKNNKEDPNLGDGEVKVPLIVVNQKGRSEPLNLFTELLK